MLEAQIFLKAPDVSSLALAYMEISENQTTMEASNGPKAVIQHN